MRNNHQLCVVISGPSFDDAAHQIQKVRDTAELVEFRIDLFSFHHLSQITALKESTGLPVIFTLRKTSQGGKFSGLESERLLQILQLMELHPDFFDLESDCPDSFFEAAKKFPKVKIICSKHIFEDTPHNLLNLFEQMFERPAAIYKLATAANSSLDSMRMLKAVKELSARGKSVVGICMGELGQSTRILGPIFGSLVTYAASDVESGVAPGQMDVESLIDIYHVKHMNKQTKILGLIGDPVTFSMSDITHNAVLRRLELNGVYVKIKLVLDECESFLKYAQELGFYGLSVTMPLKEHVLKFVKADSNVLPINTIFFEKHSLQGYNTDGIGFLQAIKPHLNPSLKRVVLLGAGGAAKAAAYALKDAGLDLIILNRNIKKAQALAESVGGKGYDLHEFPKIAKEGYDLLVNTTSVGMFSDECPIDPVHLIPNRIVVEMISVPRATVFVHASLKKQCPVVYGYEMFMHQAAAQFAIWFGEEHVCQVIEILKEKVTTSLKTFK